MGAGSSERRKETSCFTNGGEMLYVSNCQFI